MTTPKSQRKSHPTPRKSKAPKRGKGRPKGSTYEDIIIDPQSAVSTPQKALDLLAFPTARHELTGQAPHKLSRLSTASYARFLELIRMGSFEHVAAGALGIIAGTYYKWMNRGAMATHGPYRKFYLDVLQARNQARIQAECEVRITDPKFWLTKGPGKPRSESYRDKDGSIQEVHLEGWDSGEGAVQVNVNNTIGQQSQNQDIPTEDEIELTTKEALKKSLNALEELGYITVNPAFRESLEPPLEALPDTGITADKSGENMIPTPPKDSPDPTPPA